MKEYRTNPAQWPWCRSILWTACLLFSSNLTAEPQAPVLISTKPAQIDNDLLKGYQQLSDNAFEGARQSLQKALLAEPDNTDALLALAALAARQGKSAENNHYLQRAWRADPLDANVQAAIFGRRQLAAVDSESRLKIALNQHPDSGPLHFALGNLYAQQKRWPESQQAYFSAVAADGDNPDYLYNLAVSLEHLKQPGLAAQQYQLALLAAERRTAAFDVRQIENRLRELLP